MITAGTYGYALNIHRLKTENSIRRYLYSTVLALDTIANRTHEPWNQKAAVGILPVSIRSSMYEVMAMPDTTPERSAARERSTIAPVNGKRVVRHDFGERKVGLNVSINNSTLFFQVAILEITNFLYFF
jgi:hypothetical protein